MRREDIGISLGASSAFSYTVDHIEPNGGGKFAPENLLSAALRSAVIWGSHPDNRSTYCINNRYVFSVWACITMEVIE
jgi:hypothetical protein